MSNQRKKILILSPYSIAVPMHGGSKRVAAIAAQYRQLGYEVRVAAIYADNGDVTVKSETRILIKDQNALSLIGLANRYQTGGLGLNTAIMADNSALKKIVSLVNKFNPEIIHAEQPFFVNLLEHLADTRLFSGKIIYGSQNIEYKMRKQMLRDVKSVSCMRKKIVVHQVKQLEAAMIRLSSAVVAVSEQDAHGLRKIFKIDPRKIIVAPNGISELSYSDKEIRHVRKELENLGVTKIALFIGSAHKPNLDGFIEMLSQVPALASFQKIAVVGGVANLIDGYMNNASVQLRKDDLLLYGNVAEDRLTALISLADLILLPITSGGGSNLKTAEAILSGKSILATSYAFRGYEPYEHLAGVHILNKPCHFVTRLVEMMSSTDKLACRSEQERSFARNVLWENTLKNLAHIEHVLFRAEC
ncbi:MAG: glycosyltransferase family 4 protein [Candidatus Nomurabacteria bacterium]|jgi:glycosyltransferase involved in cell wall biosynthesis|nr:glycosyltransferase family 4 protein [Candidatus Nomurabacteria bacterium]